MIGEQTTPHTELPKITTDGTLEPEPEIVLDRRLVKRGQRAGVELLIQWKGMNKDDATWVDREELKRRFPNLVDKVFRSREYCYETLVIEDLFQVMALFFYDCI